REAVRDGLNEWTEAIKAYEQVSTDIANGNTSEECLEAQSTARETIERLGGWERDHEVDYVIDALGLPGAGDKRTIAELSGGMRRRTALAKLLVAAPDLAILDEPSNHLDADTIAWLEKYFVESFKGAVLVVTHDRWLLDQIVTRTVELDHGLLHSYDGGYGAFLEAKAERMMLAERTERNRQNFLRTEIEWLRRQPKARTTKQKARIERAEDAKLAKPMDERELAEFTASTMRSGKTIVDLQNLGVRIADRWLARGLHLCMVPGSRVGIVGPNGAGKTTLLRTILGEIPAGEGEVVRGKNVKFGYLEQTRLDLAADETVYEVVSKSRPVDADGKHVDPRVYLEKFQFDSSMIRQKVSSLSGGERARVALACLLAQANNLLILDEPTNDLDIETLSRLEEMLTTYEGSVLVVTHDRYFLDRVVTGILAFEPADQAPGVPEPTITGTAGRVSPKGECVVTYYAGAYQAYSDSRRIRMSKKAAKPAKPKTVPPPAAAQPEMEMFGYTVSDSDGVPEKRPSVPIKKSALSKNEQKELDTLPEKLEAAEALVQTLEIEENDPALYERTDAAKERAASLKIKIVAAKAEVDRLMTRWELLESKR
ncbi:MAG: ABC-F family ATP-binding cassette domain-containing protein, partial [Polyangiaceae bacterium]|nr:ABC-F family ATP-binding cassette domain-containing protein [Polyangiaceae bacterium]